MHRQGSSTGTGAHGSAGLHGFIATLAVAVAALLVAVPPAAADAPTVEASFAAMISDRQARVAAYLNPEGSDTEYHFEYGTTGSYGSVAPASPRGIGGGIAAVSVSVPLSGLAPATTYHFRLVATNGDGTTFGPDTTFTTLPAAAPAQARGYELVSPPDKHGADVILHGNGAYNGGDFSPYASQDGDRVAFTSYGSFAGSPSHGVFSVYMAERGAGGWTTKSLNEPLDGASYSSPFLGFNAFSPDLSRWAVLGPAGPQLTPEASPGSYNAFVWWPGQGYQLTTPTMPPDVFGGPEKMVASADFRRLVMYMSGPPLARAQLTPDTPADAEAALYGWSAERPGEVTYLAREPVTEAPMSGSSLIAHPQLATATAPNPAIWNALSDNGSRLYFLNKPKGAGVYQLYLRLVDEGETIHVSASRRGEPDPNKRQAVFRFASAAGDVAFFTSGEKLTDDATTGPESTGSDLYRFELEGEELTDITVDADDPKGAEVQGVIGGSQDGTRLYFVAKGALAPGAVAGRNNLYMWSDDGTPKGEIKYISHGLDQKNWDGLSGNEGRHFARVTPDGKHALFQTAQRITEYDNAGRSTVYLYDAEADRLQCASCDPTGKPASADAQAIGSGDFQQAARTLTDDGRFVFFSTAAALVSEDVNGLEDVYQFDSDTGRIDLISPGTGPVRAVFLDAGADGRDVLFGTREQLVRIDFDRNADIYDARIGGGIAAQNPPLAGSCSGEACRPAPLAPPPPAAAGSAALHSAGNLKSQRRKAQKKKAQQKKRKAAKRRAAKRRAAKRRAAKRRAAKRRAAMRKAKQRRQANGRRG